MASFTSLCFKARLHSALILLVLVSNLVDAQQQTRPFQMAATAVQMIPLSSEPYRNGNPNFPIASMANEVDLVAVWPEYLGIPYDIFATSTTIPTSHPWYIKMQTLRSDILASGKPLLLELGFVRTGMVGLASVNNGELTVNDGWLPVCYDFSQPDSIAVGNAYVNYAKWMADFFQPAYLVNFIEANLYYADCSGPGPAWDHVVDIQNRAYNAVKSAHPNITIASSFHAETLYEYELHGWNEEQYQAISAMAFDVFGISVYPFGVTRADGNLITPYELPADYIVRPKLRHPELKLAITETGWNNVSINIGDTNECIHNFPFSTDYFAGDYLNFVFNSAHYGQFSFVNWWSFRDQMRSEVLGTCYVRDSVPFVQCNGDPWCSVVNYMKDVTFQGGSVLFSELVLKAFGSMGLKDYDGNPRPLLYGPWMNEFQKPYTPVN